MILGCSDTSRPVAAELGPIAVDAARWRCPDVDPRMRSAIGRPPVPPPAPATLPDGRRALTDDQTRVWIDGKESNEVAKTTAGEQLLREYEACRGSGQQIAAVRP